MEAVSKEEKILLESNILSNDYIWKEFVGVYIK